MEDGGFVFEAGVDRPEEAVRPQGDENSDIRPLLEQAQARLVEWGEIVAVVPSLAHTVELAAVAPEGGVVLDGSQWAMVVAIGEGRPVQEVLDRLGLPEFDGCKALKELTDDGVARVPAIDNTGGENVVAIGVDPPPEDIEEPHSPETATVADETEEDNPDALADRGPWRLEELASLEPAEEPEEEDTETGRGQDDTEAEAETPTPAAPTDSLYGSTAADDSPLAEDDEDALDADGEPINRGLLLKFLSSVRS
jgi:hypothetical protein